MPQSHLAIDSRACDGACRRSAAEEQLHAVSSAWDESVKELHEEYGLLWKTGRLHVPNDKVLLPKYFDGNRYVDSIVLFQPKLKLRKLTAKDLLDLVLDMSEGFSRQAALQARTTVDCARMLHG